MRSIYEYLNIWKVSKVLQAIDYSVSTLIIFLSFSFEIEIKNNVINFFRVIIMPKTPTQIDCERPREEVLLL